MSTVADRVKKIICEHLGGEADKMSDTASFINDMGADSLDTVELVMALEEEFDLEIPDDAAEKILTVGDAVAYVESCAQSGKGSGTSDDEDSGIKSDVEGDVRSAQKQKTS